MTERGAYWSGHLAAIERERITARAYGAREGVSVSAPYLLAPGVEGTCPIAEGESR